jgi:DNA helicase-2/ATP-dependent DNA helicase PcrA
VQRRWCFLSDDRSQQNAIYHPVDSSLFVTAPPGYGKTYVMSKRMEYLISKGCVKLPNKLLGLTFSNAAADEMKKRIMKSIPNCDKYIDIMNFHTFAYNVLRLYGNYLDIDRCFTLVNEKKKTEYKMEYYENNTSIADIWKHE